MNGKKRIRLRKTNPPLYLLTALFLISCNLIYGQTQLRGRVIDSASQPLPQVNVLLYQHDSLIAFQFTNTTGHYAFQQLKKGTYRLKVTALGYAATQTDVLISGKHDYQQVTTQLHKSTTRLKKVVLKTPQAIEIREDTIIFKANAFSRHSDVFLEDLLQNIPGISVGTDGSIRFQGKKISALKIENDNLFGQGYQILTKSLKSDLVETIQVLQHYHDNALLKGIQDSDQVALNLTLKDDKTSHFFGNADLGIGTQEHHDLKVNLMSFLQDQKFYFFGDYNNTGRNAADKVSGILNPKVVSSNRTEVLGKGIAAHTFLNLATKRPRLDDEIANLNNDNFSSISAILHPSKDIKINLNGIHFYSNRYFRSSQTRHYLTEQPFTLDEQFKTRQSQRAFLGKFDLDWEINPRTTLTYTANASIGKVLTKAELTSNQTPINQHLTTSVEATTHRFILTHRSQDSSAFVINGAVVYDRRPQDYSISPYTFGNRFDSPENKLMGSQALSRHKLTYWGLQASYIKNYTRSNLVLRAGWLQQTSLFNSSLGFSTATSHFLNAGDAFRNALHLSKNNLFLNFRYRLSFNRLQLSSTLHLRYLQTHLQSESNRISPQPDHIAFNPSLEGTYKFDSENKVEFNLGSSSYQAGLQSLFPGFVPLNYRDFYKGASKTQHLLSSYHVNLHYTYGNWSDIFLGQFYLAYRFDDRFFSNYATITADYNSYKQITLDNRYNFSTGLTLDHYLSFIESNLKLKSSFQLNNYKDVVNGIQRHIEEQNYQLHISLRSAFSHWFNFNIGTTWLFKRYQFTTTSTSNTRNSSFLDMTFLLSKRLSLYTETDWYHFKNLSRNKSVAFTNLTLNYNFKTPGLQAYLKLNNLFDSQAYHLYSVSDLMTISSSTQLIRRYALLGLNFSF